MIRIAIDAMGGDFGPRPIVVGTIRALKKRKFTAILVGKRSELLPYIPKKFLKSIEFVDCEDVFGMEESATDVLKRKDCTIYRAVDLVREGKADAVVSAGHSGATMSLSTLRIGRIKGVSRPAIATLMPTKGDSQTLVLDVGANTDCKSEHLFEFGVMGKAYAVSMQDKEAPTIGLLSNGEEKSKGNEATKGAYKLLEKLPTFKGNVEGNNIFDGSVDVVICDGFVGNILLKTSEGVADSISTIIKRNVRKSPLAIAGALLMRKVFRILRRQVDYAEYGGAPLLGVKKCTIICHGKSNEKAIKNAIFQAIKYADTNISADIENTLELYKEG